MQKGIQPGNLHERSVSCAGERRPLAVDLCVGLGGWVEGLTAEGWFVIGVDIEDMFVALSEPKPAHFALMRQDIRTLHGSQFKHADLIVGSSPCQDFSYRAMPWTRARALTGPFLGIKLFHEQFRIQREASEAKGEHIPMVVENVRGAEPWIGKARWFFGSFGLWGDVPALMPTAIRRKVPGFRFDGSGRSFQTASVEAHGMKAPGGAHIRDGAPHTARLTNPAEGRKGAGVAWFDANLCQLPSASPRRKAASAKIAKIPEVLARHIGRTFYPREVIAA